MARSLSVRGAIAIASAVLLADIATKAAIVAFIPLRVYHPLTPWFNLGHWLNPGAAFSFLAQAGGWQRGFFIAVGLIASVFLCWLITRPNTSALERVGYAGILGGALGNVVDRVFRGAVVDWLDFHWGDWHWPAFNVADIGITLGAAALVLGSIRAAPSSAAASDVRP
jgi:signal peptidase II